MLHNRYKIKGGEDESTLAESAMLRSSGHDVKLLELDNDLIPSAGNVQTAASTIWSRKAHRIIHDHLGREKFDILHVQNFFPLWSPSVYYAAADNRVAVVQSVRNYRLICPAASLFRDGHHCELCVGKKVAWPGVVHGCYRGSRLATSAIATMLTTHWALGTWARSVHQYIALTHYVRDQLIAGHFPENRIAIKPNFIVDPRLATSPEPGEYFIYVGRLTREKGLAVLFDAWNLLKNTRCLKLVGGGTLPDDLRVPDGVEIVGTRAINETYRLIAGAKALILPAQWAEPFGRVIIEAFALGTPVISSSAGALPELIEHDVSGLLVDVGNPHSLAAAIERISVEPALRARLSKRALQIYVTSYTDKVNYEKLMQIYERALEINQQTKAK
jgi:glycosyltransferase involved in cell wall biosynthesis